MSENPDEAVARQLAHAIWGYEAHHEADSWSGYHYTRILTALRAAHRAGLQAGRKATQAIETKLERALLSAQYVQTSRHAMQLDKDRVVSDLQEAIDAIRARTGAEEPPDEIGGTASRGRVRD